MFGGSEVKKSLALVSYYCQFCISRWHNKRRIKDEDVGSHAAKVGVIAVFLADLYLEKNPTAQVDRFRVLWYAQFHDVEELYTGDTPGYIKISHPELYQALEVVADRTRRKILAELPESLQVQDQMTDIELRLIKLADKISGYYYCKEEVRLGNSLEFQQIADDYCQIFQGFGELQWLYTAFFETYGRSVNTSSSAVFEALKLHSKT